MAKSKYESHVAPYLDKIALWAENGASQAEIANKLGMGVSTFKKYLALGEKGEQPYVDLVDRLTRANETPDDNVEACLYKSATGYNAVIQKTFKVKEVIYNEETGRKIRETEKLVTGHDEVHVPANVTAQMFWLTNRRGDKWRYKPEPVSDDGEGGTGIVELPAVMEKPAPPGEVSGDG